MSSDSSIQSSEPRTSIRVVKQRVSGRDVLPPEEDFLAIEDPLNITLFTGDEEAGCGHKPLTMTMRTPGDDVAMIYGFMFAEGIIQAASDVLDVSFDHVNPDAAPTQAQVRLRSGLTYLESKAERHFAMHSSCGVCGKVSTEQLALPASLKMEDRVRVNADCIHGLPDRMRDQQATFQKTGGLHAAALFDADGQFLVSAEDIGRHNALDKVIGHGLQRGGLLESCAILCVSGRMSYEILQKALIARIPIIAGVGAPSSLAVSIANDFNITLIGFVRNGSYNIYSAPQRLRGA